MGNGNNNGNNGKSQPLKKVRIDDLQTFSPITDNQRKTYEAYRENQHLLLHGIAGTGKTFLSLYLALEEVLDPSSDYNDIFIVRSVVSTRDIGFLPGDEQEKVSLYEAPYRSVCGELFGIKDAYDALKQQNNINMQTNTRTNVLSSTNVQTFPFMERFEYIGTCNVTNWSSTFYRSGIIDFKATATAATDCTSLFRESNVRYLTGAIGNGSCNGTSIFHNTRNLETIGDFDISGLSIMTNGFFTSVIQTIGTPSNPVSLNASGVTATSFARGCPLLREVHFDAGYLKSNQSVMFYQCKNLTVIKGLNFSTAGLVDVFNDLPSATATITITGNPGTAGLSSANLLIATNKGWTVTT